MSVISSRCLDVRYVLARFYAWYDNGGNLQNTKTNNLDEDTRENSCGCFQNDKTLKESKQQRSENPSPALLPWFKRICFLIFAYFLSSGTPELYLRKSKLEKNEVFHFFQLTNDPDPLHPGSSSPQKPIFKETIKLLRYYSSNRGKSAEKCVRHKCEKLKTELSAFIWKLSVQLFTFHPLTWMNVLLRAEHRWWRCGWRAAYLWLRAAWVTLIGTSCTNVRTWTKSPLHGSAGLRFLCALSVRNQPRSRSQRKARRGCRTLQGWMDGEPPAALLCALNVPDWSRLLLRSQKHLYFLIGQPFSPS